MNSLDSRFWGDFPESSVIGKSFFVYWPITKTVRVGQSITRADQMNAANSETVLITGASSGIGLELARCFAADGCRLILLARNTDALEALAGELRQAHKIETLVLTADLSRPETPARVFKELQGRGIKVDVLVNNAGFGANGTFAGLPLQRQLEMIQVNITALTNLTGLFLPGMIERRRGGVLNVGSLAGFLPGPGMDDLLRDQSLRAFLHRGAGGRTRRHGSDGDGALSRPDGDQFRQHLARPKNAAAEHAQNAGGNRRELRPPRFSPGQTAGHSRLAIPRSLFAASNHASLARAQNGETIQRHKGISPKSTHSLLNPHTFAIVI